MLTTADLVIIRSALAMQINTTQFYLSRAESEKGSYEKTSYDAIVKEFQDSLQKLRAVSKKIEQEIETRESIDYMLAGDKGKKGDKAKPCTGCTSQKPCKLGKQIMRLRGR